MFSQILSEVCNVRAADTARRNFWYPPIQEFIISENAGFQLAKTEILFKSKIVSFQIVKYSISSDFTRSWYFPLEFIYPRLNLLNTCSKLGFPTNLLLQQFLVYYHCFFENFQTLITQTRELWYWHTY